MPLGISVLDLIEFFATSDESPAGEFNIRISTAAPSSLGVANAAGSAASLARSDHVHDGRHTLLDASKHSDTSADAVTRGSLMVGNVTPAWDELVLGPSSTIFQSDGTDPSWVAMSGDATIAAGGGVTVAATHAGSTHQAAVTTHEAASDPHTGYIKETEKGAASGVASLSAGSLVEQEPYNASASPVANCIVKGSAATGRLANAWGGGASELATLNTSTLVAQNPASATATPGASKIPIAGGAGTLDGAWVPDSHGVTSSAHHAAVTVPDGQHSLATQVLSGVAASQTQVGHVELATAAEINTGTDSTRAIPVDQYVASNRNVRYILYRVLENATSHTVTATLGGDLELPFTGTITEIGAYVDTAGVTGLATIDVNKNGTTLMTTNKITIDSAEKSSRTAATPPALTTTAVTAGDIITVDIDGIQTTAAKGLTVRLGVRIT